MADTTFRAMVLRQEGSDTKPSVEPMGFDGLPKEDTLVKIEYSTLNYKDALAITGKGKIVRTWPMIPGVDFAGSVVESSNPSFKPGTRVVLTGWSVGEKYWGGYSQYQRVKSAWLVPLPDKLSAQQAMMIGTAGLEAMLSVNTLEEAGVKPDDGPILVTGAGGGVGSVAVAILTKLGYSVEALTGDTRKHAFVSSLGNVQFVDGPEWSEMPRALESQHWAAAIDTVGSKVLARALAGIKYGGAVASCGLAGGADLPTTVMPFILRGVRLLGVDSVMQPIPNRSKAWQRFATAFPLEKLESIASQVVSLDRVQVAAEQMMRGEVTGRVLVDVNAVN